MTAHVDQGETTATPPEVREPSVQTPRRRMLLWGLGLAVLLAVTRLPSMGFYPLNVDETIYSAVAVRCNYLHQPPYVGAVDNKGPLLFWLYQLVFVLAGDYNIAATHVVGAIVVALNALMVWHISSRCFGPRAGPLGALLYLLVMASDWDFLAFNAELPAGRCDGDCGGWLSPELPDCVSDRLHRRRSDELGLRPAAVACLRSRCPGRCGRADSRSHRSVGVPATRCPG